MLRFQTCSQSDWWTLCGIRLLLIAYKRQHILLDLGSGSGARIRGFVQERKSVEHELQIHAFEPNPAALDRLRAALRHIKTSSPTVVHEAAAWIADEEVGWNATLPTRFVCFVLVNSRSKATHKQEVGSTLSGQLNFDKPTIEVVGLYVEGRPAGYKRKLGATAVAKRK